MATIVKELNELAEKMTGTNPRATTDAQAWDYIEQNYNGGSVPSNVITTDNIGDYAVTPDNIGNYAVTPENADSKGIVTKDVIKYNEIFPLKVVDTALGSTPVLITDEFTIENLNNIASDINWYILNGIEPNYAFYEKPIILTFLYSQTESQKIYRTLYATEFEASVYHYEQFGDFAGFGKLIFQSIDGFFITITQDVDEYDNTIWYIQKISTN